MHTILYLQTNGSCPNQDQSFKHTLCETSLCGLLAHDYWTQLTVVTDEHNLLCTHRNWNQSLCFNGLCSFINEHLAKTKILEAGISCANTSTANHIRCLQDFSFG